MLRETWKEEPIERRIRDTSLIGRVGVDHPP